MASCTLTSSVSSLIFSVVYQRRSATKSKDDDDDDVVARVVPCKREWLNERDHREGANWRIGLKDAWTRTPRATTGKVVAVLMLPGLHRMKLKENGFSVFPSQKDIVWEKKSQPWKGVVWEKKSQPWKLEPGRSS